MIRFLKMFYKTSTIKLRARKNLYQDRFNPHNSQLLDSIQDLHENGESVSLSRSAIDLAQFLLEELSDERISRANVFQLQVPMEEPEQRQPLQRGDGGPPVELEYAFLPLFDAFKPSCKEGVFYKQGQMSGENWDEKWAPKVVHRFAVGMGQFVQETEGRIREEEPLIFRRFQHRNFDKEKSATSIICSAGKISTSMRSVK